jgi:hypothetical protein
MDEFQLIFNQSKLAEADIPIDPISNMYHEAYKKINDQREQAIKDRLA